MSARDLLLRDVECQGRSGLDVLISAGRIEALGAGLRPRNGGTLEIDGRGGALLPGLNDHHVHLLALAAAARSVHCGPPRVRSLRALEEALASADRERTRSGDHAGWLRGVGYHESVAGALDRALLDSLVPARPLRIQHRSGALWVVNSAGLRALAIAEGPGEGDGESIHRGIERDATGRPTGRLYRVDSLLRHRLPADPSPDLAEVGRQLAAYGLTGLTDATVHNDPTAHALLARAQREGALPQRLRVMGGRALEALPEALQPDVGEFKIILHEGDLPALDALCEHVEAAHRAGRGCAFHCVTRSELVLAQAALAAAPPGRGVFDRIEHASVAPPELIALLAGRPIRVVTQPGFVHERGDAYLQQVDASDLPHLYRIRAFMTAGVPLAAGTDAPYATPDPWRHMRSACERTSESGAPISPEEGLTPGQALALFSGPLEAPGSPCAGLAEGIRADLCLLRAPWAEVAADLDSRWVRATICAGRLVYDADD